MDKVFSGHQPNLLPYMGVFYKMFQSDVFVLDDDVQYSSKGLHNANYLKVNGRRNKFTIPVSYTFGDLINEVRINYARNWRDPFEKTLENAYGRAPFFVEGFELVSKYLDKQYEFLADLNIALIKEIATRFRLCTELVIASKDLPTALKKNHRNIYQCKALGGNIYYSGTGGREYNDEELYSEYGIEIVYSTYEPKPYPQGKGEFIENLSVLDYIMYNGFDLPLDWVREK